MIIMPTTRELLTEAYHTMRSDITKTVVTGLSALVTVAIMSACFLTLMGWGCAPEPEQKPLTLEYDRLLVKEDIVRVQPQVLAEQTERYNKRMEELARAKK
jgi:hypothetical protein